MSCVYKHTFPNGAVYIGRTDMKPEDRWLNGWGYKNCPLMFNAIIKFGWDNVKHEIIADNLTTEESIAIESQEIALHSDLHSPMHSDGHSDKHREPCTMIYNIQEIPAQTIAQENAHFIDHNAQSPNIPNPTNHFYYKAHLIPIVEKPIGMRYCPIDVYTVDGTFICTYPSAKIASQELQVNHGDITSCCKGVKSNGQPRYQVKGYVFRYHV